MAIKRYNVTQTVTYNNQKHVSSFQFVGEEAQLTALLALLEGGYRVTEVNDALSDMTAVDTNVTSIKKCTKIGLTSEPTESGDKTFASIKPYKGAMILKSTVGVEDVEGALVNGHMFPIAPTLKVAQVYSNMTKEGGE